MHLATDLLLMNLIPTLCNCSSPKLSSLKKNLESAVSLVVLRSSPVEIFLGYYQRGLSRTFLFRHRLGCNAIVKRNLRSFVRPPRNLDRYVFRHLTCHTLISTLSISHYNNLPWLQHLRVPSRPRQPRLHPRQPPNRHP